MSATLSKGYSIACGTHIALNYLHLDHLVMAGLITAIAIANQVTHGIDAIGSSSSSAPVYLASVEESSTSQDTDTIRAVSLTAPMRAALEYVSRRYRVSAEALLPIFEAAEAAGRERHIDPMLLIAIISIESGFNPYSQSVLGAQGLMQIIPRFYLDKVPKGSGNLPFLDPVTNVRIGAEILQETIQHHGSLMVGLQQYGGAADDEDQAYANKVMAEKQRLDQVPAPMPQPDVLNGPTNMHNTPILQYLKKYGQQLDSEIAAATGISLRKVRISLSDLAARGEISRCSVTRFNEGKPVEGTLCRVAGFIPPSAPGPKPGAKT